MKQQLKGLQSEKRALILKNSHIGGHRYAGNAIVGDFCSSPVCEMD